MQEPQEITADQLRALTSSLNQQRISNRRQGGRTLAYLEAWDVKATLIRVFGFGGFSADVIDSKIVRMEKDVPAMTGSGAERTQRHDEHGELVYNWSVAAQSTVRLRIHQTGATYTESAVASQVGPDIGEVSDFALKTASSDALKRAAIYLGTQFGLSLYNNGSTQDVVRVVLAEGQRWPQPEPEDEEKEEALGRSLGKQEGKA